MKVALDTNAYTDFMRGKEARVRIVRTATSIHLPLFVLAELHAGFAAGSQTTSNAANLQRFINARRVHVVVPDEVTATYYAQIYWGLRRQGTPIPTHDVWIAALVVQHNLVLCTADSHFRHIPQLATC